MAAFIDLVYANSGFRRRRARRRRTPVVSKTVLAIAAATDYMIARPG
jgi:hypothetical protein